MHRKPSIFYGTAEGTDLKDWSLQSKARRQAQALCEDCCMLVKTIVSGSWCSHRMRFELPGPSPEQYVKQARLDKTAWRQAQAHGTVF